MKYDISDNKNLTVWLGGFALGAVAMYLSDPNLGRQRRALAQEKFRDVTHRTSDTLSRTGGAISHAMQDTGSRLSDLKAQAGNMVGRGKSLIDEQVLEARVRARLALIASRPSEIDVLMHEAGRVSLSGTVSAKEKERILTEVGSIPGVTDIDDKLHIRFYGESDSAPRRGSWGMGSTYDEYDAGDTRSDEGMLALLRRSPVTTLLALVGVGLLVKALGGKNLGQMLGREGESETINLQKTIEINASPETVFGIWSKYENFPQFMSHVVEVQDLGMQRSHWVVKGPAGKNLEWDSVLTKCLPPSMMAWESEPGATVDNAGSVRFEAANGGTRVTVRISYSPPAGAVGEGIAELMGNDPERELEEDLSRMKNFIESGNIPRESAQVLPSTGQILH